MMSTPRVPMSKVTLDHVRPHAEKLWSLIERGEGCWTWRGRTNVRGYGHFHAPAIQAVLAHRAAFMLTKGEIPKGMLVCHACDNPPCCNPEHLWLGTSADNNHDRDAKGRHVRPDRDETKVNRSSGAKQIQAKLSAQDIAEIVADERSGVVLGKIYGVHATTINRARSGRSYKVEITELRKMASPTQRDEGE